MCDTCSCNPTIKHAIAVEDDTCSCKLTIKHVAAIESDNINCKTNISCDQNIEHSIAIEYIDTQLQSRTIFTVASLLLNMQLPLYSIKK